MINEVKKAFFAPQLYIKRGVYDIGFYLVGLGAVERRRWTNDDGSLHVVELSIDDAVFHLHEEKPGVGQFEPTKINGVTALIGLFVNDVDKIISNAVNAGATVINPAQDYDYGYRQGEIRDPFGHVWLIQKKI
ncbi:MAG: VOC family protein [Chitinophagaceae bacterium]